MHMQGRLGFVFVVNQDKQQNTTGYNRGPWWKPAMQVFSEISTWIAVPVILAVVFGSKLDNHYDTKPLWLLILAGFSFLLSAYGIVKTVRKYQAKLKKDIEHS